MESIPPPPFLVAVISSMARGRMRLKVQERKRTQNNIPCTHRNRDKGLKTLPTYCNMQYSLQVVPDPVWLWLQFIPLPGARQDSLEPRQAAVFSAGSAQGLKPGIPNEGSHTVALPRSPAPSCSPAPLPWQLHGKDCAPCPVFGCDNHEKMYIYFLYVLSSSQGNADQDFCTPPYWKGEEGLLVSPRLVNCHQKAALQNGRGKWDPISRQQADCPREAGSCLPGEAEGIWECL